MSQPTTLAAPFCQNAEASAPSPQPTSEDAAAVYLARQPHNETLLERFGDVSKRGPTPIRISLWAKLTGRRARSRQGRCRVSAQRGRHSTQ
jgi:hypothetical protein